MELKQLATPAPPVSPPTSPCHGHECATAFQNMPDAGTKLYSTSEFAFYAPSRFLLCFNVVLDLMTAGVSQACVLSLVLPCLFFEVQFAVLGSICTNGELVRKVHWAYWPFCVGEKTFNTKSQAKVYKQFSGSHEVAGPTG